jgi:hypothetical protein
MAAGGAGMGSGMTANMPNAMCLMGATGAMPMCDACACTPNAMNGCLEQLTACAGAADANDAMLCKAIIDCASMNNCTGAACLSPCMTQISAATMMGTNAVANATAVGDCTSTKCMAVCPH